MSDAETPSSDLSDHTAQTMTSDSPSGLLGVGDRLRAAREAKNLSLADVSQTIKISVRVLEQVEGNAWGQMAGYTFARGVVRSYARLVQMDPEPLLKELDSAQLPRRPLLELPRSTHTALPVPGDANKRDRVATVAGIMLVAAAVVAYFLVPDSWLSKSSGNVGSRQPSVSVPVVAQTNEKPAPLVSAVAEVALSAPVVVQNVQPSPAVAVSAAAVLDEPKPSANKADVLVLRFVDSSWAEVRDANGVVLLSENMAAGSERGLGGTAPYSIWLGNAEGVRLAYRGQSVDLRPHTRQRVARLNLE